MNESTEVFFRFLGERSFTLDPILCTLNLFGRELSIRWYGALIAFGFALAVLFGGRQVWKGFLQSSRLQKYSLPKWRASLDGILDVLFGGTICGIIGARLYYVAFQWDSFSGDLLQIVNIRAGGLAIYGGLIGGLIGAFAICRLRGVSFRKLLDLAGMSFLIGQGFGRWGNFVNQEAFGGNTTLPWGMRSEKTVQFLAANPQAGVDPNGFVHPTFLYESLWCLLGVALMYLIFRKAYHFPGQIFLCYGIWYGAVRFFVEAVRTDSLFFAGIRVSQLVSGAMVIICTLLLVLGLLKHRKKIPLYPGTIDNL
ncbi:MAG: prolipoprotein diacylglyceryl transferase [Oscillospiraceae bacterium]|nr:prolipoprotein diacylglyceryl transferase [Oscillospiraceae bacterium]